MSKAITRKHFLRLSTLAAGAPAVTGPAIRSLSPTARHALSGSFTTDARAAVVPISVAEREARIRKAQTLLRGQQMNALLLDAGTGLEYFTGLSWFGSERPMLAVLPAEGEIRYVCPAFEEDRLREQMRLGKEVFAWQEDENPYRQVALALQAAGYRNGKIGIEERLRFFILDGVRKAAPAFDLVSGDPVTVPCRMIKSPAEIALMQQATAATVSAMRKGITALQAGMSPGDVSDIITRAHLAEGADPDFALVLFGVASAVPHGSRKPQKLAPGDIVLLDCGCRVEGYSSDITRTIVFGQAPTQRQGQVWQWEQEAQLAGFHAASLGSPCEAVDAAARNVLVRAGFGPGYRLPGLPHRTGHGIGMDGHEWGNMVKGNTKALEPGMCFSIEPTLAIPGEFGVRLEDCVYMTESGPEWFSRPSPAIDKPFG